MIGYSKAPAAYGLTQGMARAAGVNLPAAVFDGWYRRDELDRLVDRCDRCGQSVKCSGWLAAVRAAPLPDWCRNKAEIEALSAVI